MTLKNELEEELVGKRIELIHTDDPYTKLVPGDQGEVIYISEMPFRDTPIQVNVKWDSGSTLSMIWGKDQYKVVKE